MIEDPNLQTVVSQKLFGATVRAGLIAFGAYLFAKWNISPEQAAVIRGPLEIFAESASALVVAIGSVLIAYAWSVWEKVTTVKKVDTLRAKVFDAKSEAIQAKAELARSK